MHMPILQMKTTLTLLPIQLMVTRFEKNLVFTSNRCWDFKKNVLPVGKKKYIDFGSFLKFFCTLFWVKVVAHQKVFGIFSGNNSAHKQFWCLPMDDFFRSDSSLFNGSFETSSPEAILFFMKLVISFLTGGNPGKLQNVFDENSKI